MRYLFDPEEDSISSGPYERSCFPFEIESHRVLIWHPDNDTSTDIYTTFYYIEFLGSDHHRNELGEHYNTLFIGNVLRELQSHAESRQTSSTCPWYAFSEICRSSYQTSTNYSSSLHLGAMFEVKKSVRRTLTADFCPWSAVDGKGINGLLSGLFSEVNRQRGNRTCCLDGDVDSESESLCVEMLFDTSSMDNKESVAAANELPPDVGLPEVDAQSGLCDDVDSLSSESEVSSEGGEDDAVCGCDDGSDHAPSSVSSPTYGDDRVSYPLLTECMYCMSRHEYLRKSVNSHLPSVWKWSLRRTRWSIRFAPQQNVDVSMTGIRIAPWRVSAGRMMSDICVFCTQHRGITYLALLDPMVSGNSLSQVVCSLLACNDLKADACLMVD